MSDISSLSPSASGPGSTEAAIRAAEEEAFYHEAALNAAWTGSRLAIGALSFLFGAFAFAYFYLFSSDGHSKWLPSSTTPPQAGYGAAIMALVVVSAVVQTVGLQRIKAGRKGPWSIAALVALVLGLVAVALQIVQLLNLPFQPGQSGFASVFVGFYPMALVIWLGAMVWLEILIARARNIPAISFVEQPPTYAQAYEVQRFQSALSAFTVVWNYLAIVAFIFWLLFYVR
jgi:heme/copper-type cytochrome/quinol oxidase subunit 3